MIKGCKTRGEGETNEERELQRPRQVVLLSFQNLVFPTSYFRLEGQGKVNEDLEIPTDRERRTEKKVKVRKSLANQSKVNFLFSFPSYRLAAMQGQDQWEYKAHTQPLLSPHNLKLSTRQTVKRNENQQQGDGTRGTKVTVCKSGHRCGGWAARHHWLLLLPSTDGRVEAKFRFSEAGPVHAMEVVVGLYQPVSEFCILYSVFWTEYSVFWNQYSVVLTRYSVFWTQYSVSRGGGP